MAWTADDLVAAVRRRAQLPDEAADGALTDADILELANEELALRLVPLVRASRGDYWVAYEDQAIVQGTARYRVPWRAQASGLRDVTIIDSSGREWPVPQMQPTERGIVESYSGGVGSSLFYMEGTDVVLVPAPRASGCTLRLRYHRAHSTLVANINTGLATYTSSELRVQVASIASPLPAYDIYYLQPPFGMAAASIVVTSVDNSNLPAYYVFTVTGLADLELTEDFAYAITAEGEASAVDLPRECWPLLVSALTARVCEIIGDRDAAALAFALYEREAPNVAQLLQPRIEGRRQKVIDRNSPLRRGRRR